MTTADTSSGSSGGPVLNSKNQVIGVHARSDNSYSFNIPSNILKDLLAPSERTEPLVEWRQRKRIRAYASFKKGQNSSNAIENARYICNFGIAQIIAVDMITVLE